jgi:hypothetical protein
VPVTSAGAATTDLARTQSATGRIEDNMAANTHLKKRELQGRKASTESPAACRVETGRYYRFSSPVDSGAEVPILPVHAVSTIARCKAPTGANELQPHRTETMVTESQSLTSHKYLKETNIMSKSRHPSDNRNPRCADCKNEVTGRYCERSRPKRTINSWSCGRKGARSERQWGFKDWPWTMDNR